MGTNCSCLRGGLTEEKQVKLGKFGIENEKDETHFKEISSHPPFFYEDNLEKIMRLQSVLRGFIDRKKQKQVLYYTQNARGFQNKPERDILPFNTRVDIQEEIIRAELKEIPENRVPDYSTSATRAVQARLGKFMYQDSLMDDSKRLKRGPVEMENGAIFTGEWNNDNHRHGFGVQIWNDGSKYEGQ